LWKGKGTKRKPWGETSSKRRGAEKKGRIGQGLKIRGSSKSAKGGLLIKDERVEKRRREAYKRPGYK